MRGLERGDLKRLLPEIARHIDIALQLPDERRSANRAPRSAAADQRARSVSGHGPDEHLPSGAACPSLVGSASDVRDLIAFRLGYGPDEPPQLARGWRAEVVGQQLDDLLAGRTSIRIVDPKSDEPLAFEKQLGSRVEWLPPACEAQGRPRKAFTKTEDAVGLSLGLAGHPHAGLAPAFLEVVRRIVDVEIRVGQADVRLHVDVGVFLVEHRLAAGHLAASYRLRSESAHSIHRRHRRSPCGTGNSAAESDASLR